MYEASDRYRPYVERTRDSAMFSHLHGSETRQLLTKGRSRTLQVERLAMNLQDLHSLEVLSVITYTYPADGESADDAYHRRRERLFVALVQQSRTHGR